MRILHILDHSLPLQSGYVFRTLGILSAQRAMGWQTAQLTTPRQRDAREPVETHDGWTFYRTPSPSQSPVRLPGLGEWREMAATERRLSEVVAETRPDILHAHSPVLNGIPAARVGRRLAIPVVYEVRAFWEDAAVDAGSTRPGSPRYRATRWLETRMLRRADAVAVLCEGVRGDIAARGIPADKITIIPNAVDIDRFAVARHRDDQLAAELGLADATVLGFIGSFYAYEGLDLLLAAMPRIAERLPDVKLLLVGGGPEDAALRAVAQSQGLKDRVVFTGRVPHGEVRRYYDLVDAFIYPRKRMRLTDLVTPLKPLEAMAQSRIVIASDVGGHRELIADGETGFLFAADDVAALAQRVVEVMADETQRHRVSAAARSFVERERSWTASAARYVEVYERALGRPLPAADRPSADIREKRA